MKNKKSLIAIAAIASIAIIGGSIAYFRYSEVFNNVFPVKGSETSFTETFKSPDNWTPCTETPKVLVVNNTGGTPLNARVKYTETWKKISDDSSLPLVVDNESMAVIHFAHPSDWVLNADGWYYYQGTIAAETGSTSSFIDYVTFNCNATADYSSARYNLKLDVQTIQADAAARQAAGWNL